MNIPDYVLLEEDIYELDFHLPDPCTEHNPHGPIELLEDYNDRYNQLILWCMIQSYWFYVVNNPQVTDMEYDYVKKYIKLLETGEDLGTEEGEVYETLKLPHEPLGFSPTRRGFNPCRQLPSRYPDFIQQAFREKKIDPQHPQWMKDALKKLNEKIKPKENPMEFIF